MAIGGEIVLEGRLTLTIAGIGGELDNEAIGQLEVPSRVQGFVGQRVTVRDTQSA